MDERNVADHPGLLYRPSEEGFADWVILQSSDTVNVSGTVNGRGKDTCHR